jgi:response regulator RpfG family c-di-GMP phosphodiesterase
MYYAGLLHDIGKIRLSEKILRKNGKLSAVEIECLRFHTIMSSNMVRGISEVEDAAKYHHERYDGKGYPEGLKGREIPESARIVAVADAYDAMSSSRGFRDHFPQEFIRSEIESECGYQFDPKIAKIMLQIIDDENFFVKHPVIYEKQILYVDDDSIAQKVMEFMLKDERNYNLTSVNSASQCLEIMEQEKFDILILDITLGEMDGFALLDKIRKNSDVPVIFVSSDKTKESVSRAKGRGVEYYLVKPFSHQELVESIEDILRKDLCE